MLRINIENTTRTKALIELCLSFNLNLFIVYTHGLTDLCTYALKIMGSHYF